MFLQSRRQDQRKGESDRRDEIFSFDISDVSKKIEFEDFFNHISIRLNPNWGQLNERDYSAREDERKKWNKVSAIFIVLFENL